jgi:hypothetical protein
VTDESEPHFIRLERNALDERAERRLSGDEAGTGPRHFGLRRRGALRKAVRGPRGEGGSRQQQAEEMKDAHAVHRRPAGEVCHGARGAAIIRA